MKKTILVLLITVLFASNADAGLVGFWGFNEGTDAIVNDSSGFNNNGFFTPGNPVWIQGKYGSALLFNGVTNAVVTIPESSSLQLNDSFTISAWVIPFSTGDNRVIEHYTAGNPMGIILRQAPSPDLGKWQVATSMTNLWSDAQVQQNVWQYITVTYDGSIMQFYTNGNFDSSVLASGSLYDDGDPWIIGGTLNDPGAPNSFNGIIDEVRIYNHALTFNEIQNDMNNNPVPEPASLLLFSTGFIGIWARRKKA